MTRCIFVTLLAILSLVTTPEASARQSLTSSNQSSDQTVLEGSVVIDATVAEFHEFGASQPFSLPATEVLVECRSHPRFSPRLSSCTVADDLDPKAAQSLKIARALGNWDQAPNWQSLGPEFVHGFGTAKVLLSIPAIRRPWIEMSETELIPVQDLTWRYNPVDLVQDLYLNPLHPGDFEGQVEIECIIQSDHSLICDLVGVEPAASDSLLDSLPSHFAGRRLAPKMLATGSGSAGKRFRAIFDFQLLPRSCWSARAELEKQNESYIMGYLPTSRFACPDESENDREDRDLPIVVVLSAD